MLCVRKDGEVVLIADGQVTMGGTVVKPNVRKTRKIGEHAIGGFAGATADAFTLFERLEGKLEEHPGGRPWQGHGLFSPHQCLQSGRERRGLAAGPSCGELILVRRLRQHHKGAPARVRAPLQL